MRLLQSKMTQALVPTHGCIKGTGAMLLIPCPYCGLRDESEYVYGGPARALPDMDAQTPEAQHSLYRPINPRGPLRELWYHSGGCECWITLTRNTITHEFEDDLS